MADTKITALTALTAADPANDVLPIVDVSDTTMAASGTTKKISVNNILGASGTATLASATITGDLTVDTSTLKVDSANNRVGIGVAVTGFGSTLTVSGDIEIVGGNKTLFNSAGFLQIGTSTANYLALQTNSTERYRIASDGVATWSNVGGVAGTAMTLNANGLGIGVTPSAWSAGKAVELAFKGNSLWSYAQDNNYLSSNAYFNGGWKYGGTGKASLYSQYQGTHIWSIAGSGTAGNAITLTDAMTLDASGNVGIGVTPSAWATTFNVKAFQTAGGSLFNFSNTVISLTQNSFYNTSGGYSYANNGFASEYYQMDGKHIWRTAASGTAGNAVTFTQAMTLDASGNLLVGTTSGLYRGQFVVTSGADRSIFAAQVTGASNGLQVQWNHATTTIRVILANIPTSSAGLASGTLWNDAGTIKIV